VAVHTAGPVYSHFGAADHMTGRVHIRTFLPINKARSVVNGIDIPIHTVYLYGSMNICHFELTHNSHLHA